MYRILFYVGACMDPRNETVRNFCARVRGNNRCMSRPNCNTTVRPTDGCCPVCGKQSLLNHYENSRVKLNSSFYAFAGGGVSMKMDDDALERFSDEFDDARTTNNVRQRMTDSGIVRDTSGKCNVEAQFTSNGNAGSLAFGTLFNM